MDAEPVVLREVDGEEGEDSPAETSEENLCAATGSASASSVSRQTPACPPAVASKSAFPYARVKTIMKSAPDSTAIGSDSVFAVSRATEYFITYLTRTAQAASESGTRIDYKDLAHVVANEPGLSFLRDVVPKKILVRDYFAATQS